MAIDMAQRQRGPKRKKSKIDILLKVSTAVSIFINMWNRWIYCTRNNNLLSISRMMVEYWQLTELVDRIYGPEQGMMMVNLKKLESAGK